MIVQTLPKYMVIDFFYEVLMFYLAFKRLIQEDFWNIALLSLINIILLPFYFVVDVHISRTLTCLLQGRVKHKLSARGKYVSVNIGPVQVVSSEQVFLSCLLVSFPFVEVNKLLYRFFY